MTTCSVFQAACMKAFKQCKHNNISHRQVAGYLAEQYMRQAGVAPSRNAIDEQLATWFDAREVNASFRPTCPSIPLATGIAQHIEQTIDIEHE